MIDKIVTNFFNSLPYCPDDLNEYTNIPYSIKRDKVIVTQGATKFVFIFDDLDYVIKVPIKMYINEDFIPEEFWGESAWQEGEYDYDEEYAQEFLPFLNGGQRMYDDYAWDYCALEEEYGILAKENGLENIVLPTTYLGEVNGYRLYKQPKADKIGLFESKKINNLTKEEKSKITPYLDGSGDNFPIDFVLKITQTFSEKFCKLFFDWAEEIEINDIHKNNIGYRNGHVVIFDYSGYMS